MKKYIVTVRDYPHYCGQPSDTYLINLDMYYRSPIVELDVENGFDHALDKFDESYGEKYSHFFHRNYTLMSL